MENIFLREVDTENFKHIYDDMLSQFPLSELKPYEVFIKLLKEKKLQCFSAFDNDIEIGYIMYAPVGDAVWLEYIAIKKEYHCKGYGRRILALLNNCYLEVEKPDESDVDTIRRIKFYTSLDAKKLDVDYVYPNNYGGLPMDLYYLGATPPEKESVLGVIRYIFNTLHADIKDVNLIMQNIL